VGEVKNGAFRGQFGVLGADYSLTFDGKIQPDGTASISGRGKAGPPVGVGDPPAGSTIHIVFPARLDESSGTGMRMGGTAQDHTCNLVLTKHGAGSAPPMPIVTTSDVRRFDGLWLATETCQPTKDARGWTRSFVGEVKDGAFHGQFKVLGAPDSVTFDGTIQPDGTAWISGSGKTGPPAGVGDPPVGSTIHIVFPARLNESSGIGTRMSGDHPCNLVLVKYGARSSVAALSAEPDAQRFPSAGGPTAPATATDVGRSAALSGSVAPAATRDVRRFDGLWKVTIRCEQVSPRQPKWALGFCRYGDRGRFPCPARSARR
jgi:hypothetical protein